METIALKNGSIWNVWVCIGYRRVMCGIAMNVCLALGIEKVHLRRLHGTREGSRDSSMLDPGTYQSSSFLEGCSFRYISNHTVSQLMGKQSTDYCNVIVILYSNSGLNDIATTYLP